MRLKELACIAMFMISSNAFSASNWGYVTSDDAMGRGQTSVATTASLNQVDLRFPYNGRQNAIFMMRVGPDGQTALIGLVKAQFNCSAVDGCEVLIRFDQSAAFNCEADTPDDGSTNVLALHCFNKIKEGLAKAKVMRIQAPFYQNGNQIFKFSVTDYRAP